MMIINLRMLFPYRTTYLIMSEGTLGALMPGNRSKIFQDFRKVNKDRLFQAQPPASTASN